MSKYAVQLAIRSACESDRIEQVTCKAVLREVPGARVVYDGRWEDRDVIVKLFVDKLKGRIHVRKEWRGLETLGERGADSAKGLFYGQTDDGGWALVMEKIPQAVSAREVFDAAADAEAKIELVLRICGELAVHHEKGIIQRDLHLGNFLLGDGRVYLLDPAQMEFVDGAVGRQKSISQLGLLGCALCAMGGQALRRLLEEYCGRRGWEVSEQLYGSLQEQAVGHRKRQIRRGLRKCLRSNKRHRRVRGRDSVCVFERSFIAGGEVAGLIDGIDGLMDGGEILKAGNTCYVCRMQWNGRDVVVKRYNHKGVLHSARHTVKRSRARRAWLAANHLGMVGVATARPVAYIEKFRGALLWQSYLLCEYVDGRNLDRYLGDDVDSDERAEVLRKTGVMFELLDVARISHMDLKPSNIMICSGEPVLVDLDAMEFSPFDAVHRMRFSRSMQKFAERSEKLNLGIDVAALMKS